MSRRVGRAAILLLASLATGGCSMVFPLDLVVREGRLLFWTEREWRWFFIPHRPTADMCAVDVWSGRQWVWRIKGAGSACIENALPVAYGAAVPGTKVIVPPQPLRRNTDYVVRLTSWETGWKRFSINDAGILSSEDAWGEADPEDQARQEAYARDLRELRAQGLTDEQAYRVLNRRRAEAARAAASSTN